MINGMTQRVALSTFTLFTGLACYKYNGYNSMRWMNWSNLVNTELSIKYYKCFIPIRSSCVAKSPHIQEKADTLNHMTLIAGDIIHTHPEESLTILQKIEDNMMLGCMFNTNTSEMLIIYTNMNLASNATTSLLQSKFEAFYSKNETFTAKIILDKQLPWYHNIKLTSLAAYISINYNIECSVAYHHIVAINTNTGEIITNIELNPEEYVTYSSEQYIDLCGVIDSTSW